VNQSFATDDLHLIRSIAKQDMNAFEQLYKSYHQRLYRFIWRVISNAELVEEVLNDTMMTVWDSAKKFRGDSKLSTWIMGIAYRKALKAINKDKKHRADPIDFDIEDEQRVDINHEHKQLVNEALSELPADQKAVIEMTFFQGFSCQETAQALDCPVGTVKTRMFHARRKLKPILETLSGG